MNTAEQEMKTPEERADAIREAVAAEREACAKLCDEIAERLRAMQAEAAGCHTDLTNFRQVAAACAEAIRRLRDPQ